MSKPVLTKAERKSIALGVHIISTYLDAIALHERSRRGDVDLTLFNLTVVRASKLFEHARGADLTDSTLEPLAQGIGRRKVAALLNGGEEALEWMSRCMDADVHPKNPFNQLRKDT